MSCQVKSNLQVMHVKYVLCMEHVGKELSALEIQIMDNMHVMFSNSFLNRFLVLIFCPDGAAAESRGGVSHQQTTTCYNHAISMCPKKQEMEHLH